jgi:membrane-bound serine protease (ClpP class)
MKGNLLWPAILQIIGIVMVLIDFYLPSMGILSLIAFGLFALSVVTAFLTVSTQSGLVFLIFDLIMIPIIIYISIRILASSKATLKTTLSSKDGSVSQPEDWSHVLGSNGEAITNLRPAGTAWINGKRYDVVSRGEFIDKGSKIEVVLVDGNRVVVKQL